MPGLPIHHQLLLLKFMSIKLAMPSNHLILCHPLPLQPSIFPSIRVFLNELVLPIRWPKYWSFSFSSRPSNEYSGLISFRIDWLDHDIWSHHFMTNRWGSKGKSDRLWGGGRGSSKITADGDCSHESKRRLILGRKVVTNLDSILKSRDITLLTKVRLVKAMVFSSSHIWM